MKRIFFIAIIIIANFNYVFSQSYAAITKIQDSYCGQCNGIIQISFYECLNWGNDYQIWNDVNNDGSFEENEKLIEGNDGNNYFSVILSNLCPGTYRLYATKILYGKIGGGYYYSIFGSQTITITGSVNPPVLTGNYGPKIKDCFGSGWANYQLNSGVELGTITWTKNGQAFPTGTGLLQLDGLEAGTYTITVTDINGCTTSVSFTIPEQFRSVDFTATSKGAGCSGTNDGKILLCNLTIPSSERTIHLYDEAGTMLSIVGTPSTSSPGCIEYSGLAPGVYRISLRDNTSDCLTIKYVTIAESKPLIVSYTQKNPGCDGNQKSGSFSITVVSGSEPYTYSCEPNVASLPNPENLEAGTYVVTVRDANGCETTVTIVLTLVPPLSFDIVIHQYKDGFGRCHSSAQATNIVGTPEFNIKWSDGSTTINSNNHDEGGVEYTCTITDANGCTTTHTVKAADCSKLKGGIAINPNPAQDYITIERYILEPKYLEAKIVNSAGIVKSGNFGLQGPGTGFYGFEIADLPAGVYYVMFYDDGILDIESAQFVKY